MNNFHISFLIFYHNGHILGRKELFENAANVKRHVFEAGEAEAFDAGDA